MQKRLQNLIAIVLAALAALAVAYFILKPISNSGDAELITIADGVYNPPVIQISPNSDKAGDFKAGAAAFATGNYKEAISHFEAISPEDKNYPEAVFFLAHSYYGHDMFRKAASTFASCRELSGQYEEQAQWAQVLAEMHYIKDRSEIRRSLRKMSDNEAHFFNSRAEKVLSEVKKLPE